MKKLLLFGVMLSIAFTSFSQKRVSGYYRKNGTYVSSYTRGGSSSYSGGGSSSSSSVDKEETPKDEFLNSTLTIDGDGFNVYVSVLKYNNQTIDIQQLKKYVYDDFEHRSAYDKRLDNIDDVEHKIDSKKLTQEETLQLVSEYGWYLKDGILSKRVYGKYEKVSKLPSFLTHSFQIVKLK
jgi:hypothetical protein